jgi:hypothetical protein
VTDHPAPSRENSRASRIHRASRELLRSHFRASNVQQRFVLDFENPGEGNLEPRVMWHGRAAIRLDGIVLI